MTTTDRELLELAAKAAGTRLEWIGDTSFDCTKLKAGKPTCKGTLWTPLHDDGDALRLAVKLGVIIGTYASYSTVDLLSPNDRIETVTVWHSETSGDPYAATRCAIVRAAAAIGRAMP